MTTPIIDFPDELLDDIAAVVERQEQGCSDTELSEMTGRCINTINASIYQA